MPFTPSHPGRLHTAFTLNGEISFHLSSPTHLWWGRQDNASTSMFCLQDQYFSWKLYKDNATNHLCPAASNLAVVWTKVKGLLLVHTSNLQHTSNHGVYQWLPTWGQGTQVYAHHNFFQKMSNSDWWKLRDITPVLGLDTNLTQPLTKYIYMQHIR